MNPEDNRAVESNAAHIVEGGCYHQSGVPSPAPPGSTSRWILIGLVAFIVVSLIWQFLR